MPDLTDKEFAWLQKIEKVIDKEWDNLNKWGQNFIENLLERFRQYGARTYISKAQWEVITKISDKIV